MSILYQSKDCSLLDHKEYILNLYKNVISEQGPNSFVITSRLFCIVSNKKEAMRKRTHDSNEIQGEIMMLKHIYEEFKHKISSEIQDKINECCTLDTVAVRELSKRLFESTVFDHAGIDGGNNSNQPLKCKIKEEYFLIPARSRFYCGCVKQQCQKLNGSKFDILIADPPWWNKFIRRLKAANDKLSYTMMYNEDIASIPVGNLLSSNCLVAVWCTNSASNITAVKNLIFPSWGVEYVTTWYWLKVTTKLEPLCNFGVGCKKQPYERLILGKVGNVKEIPKSHLFVSVPSALHSHKPPLLDLLSPYVKTENPRVLELFARYLLPNTTSVGYEPLKLQHISLYETVT